LLGADNLNMEFYEHSVLSSLLGLTGLELNSGDSGVGHFLQDMFSPNVSLLPILLHEDT